MHHSATHSVRSPPPCGEGSGVGVRLSRVRCAPERPPSPTLPRKGRGIAFGFELAIALADSMDSEGGSQLKGGVGCANSDEFFEGYRTRGPTTHGTNCWMCCLSRSLPSFVAPRTVRTSPNSAARRKGRCG